MHWRKFHVDSIPLGEEDFEKWLNERWFEKDALLDHFYKFGNFPEDKIAVLVKTQVRLKHTVRDVLSIFAVLGLVVLVVRIWFQLRFMFY